MKRPAQAAFDFEATVRAVAVEVSQGVVLADARDGYELPSDYGGETDWTERPVLPELWIELIDGPKP
jgi:hypothetical protein